MAVPTVLTDVSATALSNSPSGTESVGTALDDYIRAIQGIFRTEYDKTVPAINPGGRLTLTTALPVTTSDVTAATTIYYTPFQSDKIVLFDGTNWKQYTFTERSIAVPATTSTMYDVFLYDNSGTLTLELLAWTNDTTRATALTTQNGVLVKTGATTRRYLGSCRTTAVSGQTEDSLAKRYVWNYYNRVVRPMRVTEATDSWTYHTATIRQARASTANQLDLVIGVSEDIVTAEVSAIVGNTNANVGVMAGIGLDSTTANATGFVGGLVETAVADITLSPKGSWKGFTGVGRHFLAWLEYSGATATTTWYGDGGDATLMQAGIHGEVLG